MSRPWSDELAGKVIAQQLAEIDRLNALIAAERDKVKALTERRDQADEGARLVDVRRVVPRPKRWWDWT